MSAVLAPALGAAITWSALDELADWSPSSARKRATSLEVVMFAYGGKIYAPGRTKVTVELDAHESVHVARQGVDPDAWWDRYLRDLDFRLKEEILAHRAEYRRYCARHIDAVKRHRALKEIAGKLASPLYGPMIARHQAEFEIQ